MTDFNKNMLSPVGFSFQLMRAPDIEFFVQSVSLPGITMNSPEVPNPFIAYPVPGDHITYGEFELTYKINEDMSNYLEIFDWMTALGFPDNFDQHKTIAEKRSYSGEGIYSDATLMIMSSSMNPVMQIEIRDMFPVSLSPLTMNTSDTNIEYVDATASFRFTNYKFKRL